MSGVKGTPRFGRIAGIYDLLASIVSFGRIRKAQTHFLIKLKPNTTVLIIGGGTGWIINEVFEKATPKSVTYIEPDPKMMALSKKASKAYARQVNYIEHTHESIPDQAYDIIITNFFLDVFDNEKLPEVMDELHARLSADGQWLFTDFVNRGNYNAVQRIFVKILYKFFGVVCKLQTQHLPDFLKYFNTLPLKKVNEESFYFQMISSIIFVKSSETEL